MSGPAALPFRQFVLKVHSRCDLACDHCYVYEQADQNWRKQPRTMSEETITWTATRIREHAARHRLAEVCVVLHGGEPLLVGPAGLRRIIERLHDELDGYCKLDLRIHTNGVLLSERFCDLFSEYGVKVGISLDGDRSANDRHRRYADGRSSYEQVISAVRLLSTERYRSLFAGLLCTIDVTNDPIAVFESLTALDPPNVDFLLPHATWDEPPAYLEGRVPDGVPVSAGEVTPYADWLIAIFDRWIDDGRPVSVRTFDSIIQTTLGGPSSTESLGLVPSDLIVVETDGSLEQVDSLKVAYDGAPATGLDVFDHSLEEAAAHPGIIARQSGRDGLCDACRVCSLVETCGGGLYSHRYRAGSGFLNPSVYCGDLIKLITHARSRIRPDYNGVTSKIGAADKSTPGHSLTMADLGVLAAGFGGAGAVAALEDGQQTLRRALLAAVREAAREFGHAVAGISAAWELLGAIDGADPDSFARATRHPYVRAWAVRCLRRLRDDGLNSVVDDGIPLAADLGHLAAIAVSAAVHSGVSAELPVSVVDGAVHLPTLGRLVTGSSAVNAIAEVEDGTVTVRTSTKRWTIKLGDSDDGQDPAWEPVRTLTAPGLRVALEDTDPYRACHQWPAAPRLTEAEVTAWQRTFSDAWEVIQRDYDGYADGLAAALTTVMPLTGGPVGDQVSASARQAFGAVGVALPSEGSTLALLLIHEFQHVKLGAVLDLFDLFDETDTRLYTVPWRSDPRPLEGLLQGTYAHVAVTDFWRVRRHTTEGRVAALAATQFAHWRVKTADAVELLASSGSLTDTGERFVAGMRETVSPWLEEPISDALPL